MAELGHSPLNVTKEDLPDETLQLLVKPMSLDATAVGTSAPAPRRSLHHFYRRDREGPCVAFATALSTLFPPYTHRQNRECFCPATFFLLSRLHAVCGLRDLPVASVAMALRHATSLCPPQYLPYAFCSS